MLIPISKYNVSVISVADLYILLAEHSATLTSLVKDCVGIAETAPSFEEISQSITDLLMDSAPDDSAVAESSDEMSTSASLSSEYQQISTWCWVNIRVCYDAFL